MWSFSGGHNEQVTFPLRSGNVGISGWIASLFSKSTRLEISHVCCLVSMHFSPFLSSVKGDNKVAVLNFIYFHTLSLSLYRFLLICVISSFFKDIIFTFVY